MEIEKIAVVDLETSGLNKAVDDIFELAMVSLNLRTGEIKVLHDQLVKENDYINRDAWIFKNSDLSFDKVNAAESLDYNKLSSIFAEYPLTAYNKKFDIGFLKQRGFRINDRIPCPMMVLTPLCRLPSRHNFSNFKYPSFKEAWAFVFPNKPYKQSHRALDDATHEAQLIFQLYKDGHYKV